MREGALDPPPSAGKISVIVRQRHDDVQMIGEDHDCFDRKRPFSARHPECVAQLVYMIDQRGRSSIIQRQREEEGPTREKIAPIANHASTFPDYASLHPGYNQIERFAIHSLACPFQGLSLRCFKKRSEIAMKQLRIGDITIDAVIEREGPWRRPQDFFPAYDER